METPQQQCEEREGCSRCGDGSKIYSRRRQPINTVFMLMVVCFVLPVVAQFLYVESLAGGDQQNEEEWMMKNMHRMKWLVVWSCLLFDAAFLLSYVCLSGWKSSIMSFWCILNLTVTLLFSDHGATVEKHGAFNALGFIAVLFLSSIFMSTFMCFYDKKKCRPRCNLLGVFSLTILLLFLLFKTANYTWGEGIFTSRIQFAFPGCSLPSPWISWDLLWEGTVGSLFSVWALRGCPTEPQFSYINHSTGFVTSTCSSTPYEYALLPRLEGDTGSHMMDYVQSRITNHNCTPAFTLTTDAAVITCGSSKNLLLHCPRNPSAVDRVKKYQIAEHQQHSVPNIVVIFIDALSRAGWLRKLPKTTRLLEKIESDEEAHVAQFLRYHALGQTTKLNGVAMFTGHSKPKKDFLTLWELVKPKFVTGIVDNSCMEWSAKYLSRSTFPDHRLNSIWCLPEYIGSTTTDGETFNPFFGPWSFQRRCLFGKPVHMWAMEYATLFMNTYRDCPKFLLLKLTEAHEPSGMVVTAVDEGLHSFLSSLDLNTTAVVLVSDHGSHMGIPWTLGAFSSKLENRLPALFLVLPNWWLQQQRSAPGVKIPLEENEQALITPHNVFGTILDIAGVTAPSRQLSDCPVCTHSVISHRIPTNRTCSQANIPDQFCVCW